MWKHRFAAVFTWRILGASLVAAVVVAPWLDLARGKLDPACRAPSRDAPAESIATGMPPGELPLSGASAWIPPLRGDVRQVLAAGFSDGLPPVNDEPVPVVQPRLLTANGAEPLPVAGNLRLTKAPPEAAPDELQGPALGGPTSTVKPAAPAVDIEPLAATPWSPAKIEERPAIKATSRSESLERIAAEADRHTRHGFELAGRGAHFAARAEFIAALRVVAQGLDADQQTTAHSQALANGLSALSEAEDFLPRGGRLEANLDLKQIAAGHTTDVLKNEDLARLTPMVALQRYHAYAQEQFARAAEQEIAGSMALVGLGKLHIALATRKNSIDIVAAEPKAVTFLQAAVIVYPGNAIATNELGVLFARNGRYADARAALEHSATVSPQPSVWHNLATVYRRLNRGDLAQQADARAAGNAPASDAVKWVLPEAFAQAHADSPQSDPPAGAPHIATQAKPANNAQATAAPATKPSLLEAMNKSVSPKPTAPAEAKAQTSLSSWFGIPTKRPTEAVVAAEATAPSKPALFATASKEPAETPLAPSVATKSPATPTSVAAQPLKPALFGTPAAEASPWPRTATQPLVPFAAPTEARRY